MSFDALQWFKGPSLGTNFTLACPYTVLAHYGGLGWVAGFGVEAGLVRVSVGMEDTHDLLKLFKVALNAARIQVQVCCPVSSTGTFFPGSYVFFLCPTIRAICVSYP